MLAEAPAVFIAYDLLEERRRGHARACRLRERRARLEALLQDKPALHRVARGGRRASWEALAELRHESRERNVEGFMLKRLESHVPHGRKRGDWWKWKIDPFTVDAVLLYAHPGHGRRAIALHGLHLRACGTARSCCRWPRRTRA